MRQMQRKANEGKSSLRVEAWFSAATETGLQACFGIQQLIYIFITHSRLLTPAPVGFYDLYPKKASTDALVTFL